MQSLLDLQEASQSEPQTSWRPPADIARVPGGWLVKLDVAGVRPEDFQLTIAGRRLTVRGVRHDCQIEAGHRYYSMEISYNRFQRTLELPRSLEGAQITTDYRDGILFVRLKTEPETR